MLLSHGGESSRTAAAAVRWTVEQVLALAPDEASRKAGGGLASAGSWSGRGCDGSGAVWGLCTSGGGTPYRTVVDTTGPACRCGCPSRTFPCEHALALLLLWAGEGSGLPSGEAPDWAHDWLTDRRGRAAKGQKGTAGEAASAETRAAGPADPVAARRRAERRAERITGGAQELEQRLEDLLRGGLAVADQPGYGLWEETAARMVDAQAPGLAARVRELGAIPGSGPGWPVRLLEECALLHLLDRAWLGIDRLPEPLAATVRTRVGLTAAASGPPVRDHWLVLAQYDTPDGRLVTRRVWLSGRESGRLALLLSFGAAGRSPELALPVGVTIDAELAPYAGAGRLRSELKQRFGLPSPAATPPTGGTTAAAISAYGDALRDDPWLDSWPTTLCGVIPVPSGPDGWQLVDAEGEGALPVAPSALARPGLWKLVALSGGTPVTVFGECGHRGFDPLAAWSTALDADPGGAADPDGTPGSGAAAGTDKRTGPCISRAAEAGADSTDRRSGGRHDAAGGEADDVRDDGVAGLRSGNGGGADGGTVPEIVPLV
ncbi:SWIM zinc finger family protein [Streptomyces sp. NPDC052042]|uniref:SWIM zinc finger family protein n=1 Tax=Streptomyces sp. NPDC052042 TaxID=3365683 RepID=UPI0037CDEAAE